MCECGFGHCSKHENETNSPGHHRTAKVGGMWHKSQPQLVNVQIPNATDDQEIYPREPNGNSVWSIPIQTRINLHLDFVPYSPEPNLA